MRRLLVLLLLLVPASSASAGWSADRAQTRSGTVGAVHAAGGNGDRIALGWDRTLRGVRRAELRLGRARDGLTAAPQVLDSSTSAVEAPLPAYERAGRFLVAWRRFQSGNQRIRYRRVTATGRLGGTVDATTTGQSAVLPAWSEGPVLSWSRRTRTDATSFEAGGPVGLRLPATPLSEPGIAAGAATVAWVDEGRLLVSDRAGSAFGAPFVLATGEGLNRPRAVRVGGATLVLWRDGVDLRVAARPSGGVFGAARTVLRDTTDLAQVAVTGTGEVLVVAPVGDSSRVGALTLVRLGAGGAPLGPARALGRGRSAQLAADGTGSAFAAWMSEGAERSVTVRRIATGGILGAAHVLAARSSGIPSLATTREGGAVVAWVAGGAVHARTYRP